MQLDFKGKSPQIAENVFIAPNATIIGDVVIGAGANIWFGAVLRGDWNKIVIGENSSIQDNCVVHTNRRAPTIVGENCIVGHGVVMEGCTIGQGSLIGMNATVLSGSTLGEQSVLAAGAVVREGAEHPPRVLLAGVPAQVKRQLDPEGYSWVQIGVAHYKELMHEYMNYTSSQ